MCSEQLKATIARRPSAGRHETGRQMIRNTTRKLSRLCKKHRNCAVGNARLRRQCLPLIERKERLAGRFAAQPSTTPIRKT